MDYKLEQFDLLYQSLLNQKKHGFLHNLRPFARKKRYVEQDFLDLWYKSGFKKMQYAFQGANFNFKFEQIEVPNGQRDIYQGTDRPGVFLRYKIDPNDQKYVLQQLLDRLKNNSDKDDLAQWRTFLENELAVSSKNKIKFHLNMELQIIARIIPKSGQSFQNKKADQISQFNSGGFKGNIYIWFDLQKYKDEISAKLAQQEALAKDIVYNTQINQQQQNTEDDESANIHLTKKEYDKICIANFQMIIKDSQKEGIVGIAKKVIQGDIGDYVGNQVVTGFNRLRGVGNQKDSSQHPDIIRKKSALFDVDKPYVECVSTVTLKDWLYNIEENPERKYMGSNDKKTNESSLSKYPFELSKIKEAANPNLDYDLNTSPCWSAGAQSVDIWRSYPITKSWLYDPNIAKHEITFRFQSWIKNEDGYYFEYRFILNLETYYTKRKNIESLKEKRDHIIKTKNSYTDPVDYQQALNSVEQQIKTLQKGTFKEWLTSYIDKMKQYRPDVNDKIQIDKIIYNSKNKLVNRDGHIKGSLQALLQRDYAAGRFFEDFLLKMHYNDLKVEGQPLEEVMKKI